MLTLISPAKKLIPSIKPYDLPTTQPQFADKVGELLGLMKGKTPEDIAALMDLSKDLADLNFKRYQEFSTHPKDSQSYPAVLLFLGDVYQSLQANTWNEATLDYSQSHLRILSGLYGVLRPLDRIQPYRLEMGVRLLNSAGPSLYDFWRNTITKALNEELKNQDNPVLVNLASVEYFKAVDERKLAYPALNIHFYEHKNGALKIIGIFAKKARGAMANYIINNQIDTLEGLKSFNGLGYQFNKESSSATHFDFVRTS